MPLYIRNRRCPCLRCRVRSMMGGAILVTLGVLFLLENYDILSFDQSWPVLLIVIGVLSFAARSASTNGHVPPAWIGDLGKRMTEKAEKWERKWGRYQGGPPPDQTQNDPRQPGSGPESTGGSWEVKHD